MSDKYKFSVVNFEKLNVQKYSYRTDDFHIFHSLEWMRVIKESLGITQNVAVLEENENIVASIPFAKYRNFIKGLSALPLQFSGYYNSIIAENDHVKIKLLSKFFEYCKAQKFYTQLPEINKIEGFQSFSGYSIYKIKLQNNSSVEEQILSKANKRTRDYTKRAINSDLVSSIGGLEFLDNFYILYLQNMKELGTPPLPKKYFKKIIEYFPKEAKIILIKSKKQVCSGMLILKVSKTELFTPVISTPRLYQIDQSSHLIYLRAAVEAQNLGCSIINFGRSIDGSGPALFKQRFGIEATPLLMYSPDINWSVTDPKKTLLRFAVAIWKRLPISFTKFGGKLFAKHVI